MLMSEQERIKTKIKSVDSRRWWGDEFDVRFYLISKLKSLKNKNILDIGGGIGIICSELDQTNLRINLDVSYEDLKTCKNKVNSNIYNICASMTNLPFKKNFFDNVICANMFEVAKYIDLENNQVVKNEPVFNYPTLEKILEEISFVLNSNSVLFITTPNNAYYNKIKLTYEELKKALSSYFSNSKIFFFNTHYKFGKNRKLNMANIIPKLTSKFTNADKIIQNLLKNQSHNNYSVSFYVEAKPNG